jgi:energy-coupling factor transport system permease protein
LLLLLLFCGLGWKLLAGNLKPVIWFVVVTAAFHLIFSGHDDPDILFGIGSFAVSRTAAMMALTYSARILILLFLTFLLALTTSPLSISEAVVSLLKPLRYIGVPVYDVGMILFIALRFIPVLADEMETIRKSQYIRGVDFSGKLRQRVRRSMALILPVFLSALRRADDLSVALETRGYRSGQPRSSLHPLKFRSLDWVGFGAAAVLLVTFLAASRMI